MQSVQEKHLLAHKIQFPHRYRKFDLSHFEKNPLDIQVGYFDRLGQHNVRHQPLYTQRNSTNRTEDYTFRFRKRFVGIDSIGQHSDRGLHRHKTPVQFALDKFPANNSVALFVEGCPRSVQHLLVSKKTVQQEVDRFLQYKDSGRPGLVIPH